MIDIVHKRFQLPIVLGVEFREIPGFSGYVAGDDGTIWSCWKRVARRTHHGGTYAKLSTEWKMLKEYVEPDTGRRKYTLVVCRKHITRNGSQLVCLAFHGNPGGGDECCHNDGNYSNNRPDNLRWDSHSGNEQDKKKHGTTAKGEKSSRSKLTEGEVEEILLRAGNGDRPVDIARNYVVGESAIRKIAVGKNWKHVKTSLAT